MIKGLGRGVVPLGQPGDRRPAVPDSTDLMKSCVRGHVRAIAMVALVGITLPACTRPEDAGGTPIPGVQSGAPLYDEAIGPSDQETEIDE